MKVLAVLQVLDIHRLRGTPKDIWRDRNIGTWKGRNTELVADCEVLDWKVHLHITILNPIESSVTVPLKPWKHGGGIGTSQQ